MAMGSTGSLSPLALRFLAPPDGVVASVFNTVAETVAKYYNVPYLGANGFVEIDALFDVNGVNAAWVPRVRIITGTVAGTTGGTQLVSGSVTAGQRMPLKLRISNQNSVSAQRCINNPASTYASSATALGVSTVDTSIPFTVSVNIVPGNIGDQISIRHNSCLWMP